MNTRFGIAALAITLAGCGTQVAQTPIRDRSPATEAKSLEANSVPGEIIVGSKANSSKQASGAIQVLGGTIKSTFTLRNTQYVVKLPAGVSVADAITKISRQAGVEYAAPNRIFRVNMEATLPTAVTVEAPSDALFNQQWAYKRAGTPTNWANIDASKILVSVTDTGIDDAHPDFSGRVRRGHNFADNNGDTRDRFGHGTHCAGSVGATGNNGQGVAGVVWNAPILAVKVLGDSGSGTTEGVAQGMKYSADQGARVISMSLGSDTTAIDPVMHEALDYCLAKGSIVICAAGNNGGAVGSPANDPLAVAVSSTSNYFGIKEALSYFSSRGPQIFVSAPGDGIMSTLPTTGSQMGNTYGKASGTSMACPFVSGTATMILALHPEMTATQLKDKLKNSVDDLGGAGRDTSYGFGRINLNKASN